MLSQQEISDRLEIQDLLALYCHAIDRRDWPTLDHVFTPDADIDYTAMGGARGTLREIKTWLEAALQRFPVSQHMVGTTRLTLNGDTAQASTLCHNPMVLMHNGREHVMFCGLWYHDTLVRTPEGWRIARRAEEKGYFYNVPEDFAPAPELGGQ